MLPSARLGGEDFVVARKVVIACVLREICQDSNDKEWFESVRASLNEGLTEADIVFSRASRVEKMFAHLQTNSSARYMRDDFLFGQ